MSELGCLRDGHFNNLQVDGNLVTGSINTSIEELIQAEIQSAFSGEGTLRRTYISTGTDLVGTQHTVDSANRAVNFFKWTSGVQLFSYNIGEQSATLGIPQRNIQGYDIAGDQTAGKGKSYITSLKYSNYATAAASNQSIPREEEFTSYWAFSNGGAGTDGIETNFGLIAKFIVEIPNISGVDKLQLGIRHLVHTFNDPSDGDYDRAAFFSIEPSVSPAGGKISVNWKDGNTTKVNANVNSPTANGIIGDNQVWEFVVEITPDFKPKFRCRCQGLMGDFREQDVTEGQNNISILGGGSSINMAPFIHCVQESGLDVTPIILHSLIINTTGTPPSLEGGH